MSSQSTAASDNQSDLRPMRGLIFGALFSLIIWAVIIGITSAIGYGIAWAVTQP